MTSYVLHNLLWRDLNWLNRISLNIRLVTQKVALGILSDTEFIYWPSARFRSFMEKLRLLLEKHKLKLGIK